MDRSRPNKRKYVHDRQDYDAQSQTLPGATTTNPRFKFAQSQTYPGTTTTNPRFKFNKNYNHHHRVIGGGGGGAAGGINDFRFPKHQDAPPSTVSTTYRILCHDVNAGSVIGKSGSIIKAIRQQTGACINVHQLIPGDDERIIEISDIQWRDQLPTISPAQEALFMIHERILESDSVFGFGFDGGDEEEDYGARGGGGGGGGARVGTRLVVAKVNVGSLLGKGGKIIEQMRFETKTQIRVLPRDHNLPRCVSMSEEIVQVVGHSDAVKKAIAIISSRLRESQLHDQSLFQGPHSPEQFFPHDDFTPNMNNIPGQLDATSLGLRPSYSIINVRNDPFASHSSGYTFESGVTSMGNHAQPFHVHNIVFQILCPNDKVEKVMGATDSIIELLRGDVGVDVRVTDLGPESDERILIVSSDEGLDDDLFPAQEALLHIQSQIVDLAPDEDNIITTRLLVPSSKIKCFKGEERSLSEMSRLTGAKIQILPSEQLPSSTVRDAELVQIVGEIRAARDALIEITLRLRSYLYRRETSFPSEISPLSTSGPDQAGGMSTLEVGSPNRIPDTSYHNGQISTFSWPSKDARGSRSGSVDQREITSHEDALSGPLNRLSVPLVTRSTLEVVIPDRAISKLIIGTKLAQISGLSGAKVTLIEDRPEITQKVIQISGAPEQTEKAQSLLQGFILSTQEDDISSS